MNEFFKLTNAEWHKSSHSGGGDNCVEVATNLLGVVAVRDSKNPDGPTLTFTPHAWRTFLSRMKSSEFF